jgi:DNA ligase D-like protein (predicted ligase)/DNA ligase D-like protein (predicted polymerase)/DNA ligase D-like protein (predicted 3'-phosphoesterase)
MPRKRSSGAAFTVDFPKPLPAERDGEHWWLTIDGRELRLSNLGKVFWPEEGYTKGDLIAYYFNVAPRMLPYLAGRPLTMKRMPDGIDGPYFYEKDAPSHTPEWMPRCAVESQGSTSRWGPVKHDVINYLMVEDTAGLLFMANLGCIEFHPLHSRCGSIESPDYMFFDLDPFPPATFEDVLIVGGLVRLVCERLELKAYPKISGATGLQIYVPVVKGFTYAQIRDFVGRVGHLLRQADPGRVTMEWQVKKRSGKVFVDHNMNRVGANIAAVYSVRPEPGATVSTPVTWKEVEAGKIRPTDFTIATIWKRLRRRVDPFRGVLEAPQDPAAAFTAVGVLNAEPMSATESHRVDLAGLGTRSKETIARSKDPKLAQYLKMRDFVATPEPSGGDPSSSGSSFVIQRHDATRLHYDLRLERDGVLVSWAVPKGLPFEKGVKHLAVQTEDHPMEYGSFEGSIPKGHYGAGEVRIWDNGTYDMLEWTDRKVSFRLHGKRHRGEYHLVKTARGERDWLIFIAKASDEAPLAKPPLFSPMLATGGYEPFDRKGWWFEPKFDGVRTLLYLEGESVRLLSRTGRDQTATYPELGRLYRRISATNAVLDGEIVATDEAGKTSFELLQQRMNLASAPEIERVRKKIPVELVVFDLLWVDGEDITDEPLSARRERLSSLVLEDKGIRMIYWVADDGLRFHQAAVKLGLEGVIAKRAASRYQPGRRTDDWRKIKILKRQDCVILGWTPGQRGRSGAFGALLLGAYREGRLCWIGQVGTGFTDRMLADMMKRLKAIETDRPAVEDPGLAKLKEARWVRPELVCDVEYLQMTAAGKLRAPSFKGLRPDKLPEDCLIEEA